MSLDLKQKYLKQIAPELMKILNIKNKFAVPKISKVVVNIGLNRNVVEKDQRYQEITTQTIAKITGQTPVKNLAKKSIAGFKIREGLVVGLSTVLRGQKMYDFVEKLINIALPRIRDFRGLSKESIDHQGNLSIGLKEQTVFPEILQENVERTHGLQVVVVTTAKNKKESFELFKLLGFPFREK
jgi:large subunit ribosomal protein L5